MNKVLLAGASLLASVAAASAADVVRAPAPVIIPAAPAPTWDAYVGAGFGNDTTSGASLQRKTFFGSAETMLGSGFGVQADVLGDTVNGGGGGGGSIDVLGGGVHVFLRNPAWLLGGFVQYKNLNLGAGTSANNYFEGIEAQYLAPARWSLYGRVSAQQVSVSGGGGSSITGWEALGKARVFLVPNWQFDLRAGYNSLNNAGGGGTSLQGTMIGAGTELRFAGPLSVFAEYEHWTANGGGGTGGSLNYWEVGLKLNVGAPTLQARDKMGASLEPVKGILSIIR